MAKENENEPPGAKYVGGHNSISGMAEILNYLVLTSFFNRRAI